MHYGAKVDTTSTTNGLISLFLLITFLALPSCSKKVFATFKCNDYTAVYEGEPETVERYLALDLSVSCGWPTATTYYRLMTLYAGLMVIVYPIGIPALVRNAARLRHALPTAALSLLTMVTLHPTPFPVHRVAVQGAQRAGHSRAATQWQIADALVLGFVLWLLR